MANHHPELALEYYLRLHRSDAIDVIEKYKLYPSLQEEAVLFMEYNAYWVAQAKGKQECELGLVELRQGKAVQMLVHAVDAIPVSAVGWDPRGERGWVALQSHGISSLGKGKKRNDKRISPPMVKGNNGIRSSSDLLHQLTSPLPIPCL